jgi:uncharacterized membrane protein YqiK
MRLRRKHAKLPDPAGAAAEAIISRERAEAELERQRATAHAEHVDVVAPLRRMRERNHLAEMFIRTIQEGYRH